MRRTWPWGYVGIPFGDGPGEITCWQLVHEVLRNVGGIEVPDYGEISHADLVAVARTMTRQQADPVWRATRKPEALTVAIMGRPGTHVINHVGICVDGRNLLHADRAAHSVIVPLDHLSVRHRIQGFRRHRALP